MNELYEWYELNSITTINLSEIIGCCYLTNDSNCRIFLKGNRFIDTDTTEQEYNDLISTLLDYSSNANKTICNFPFIKIAFDSNKIAAITFKKNLLLIYFKGGQFLSQTVSKEDYDIFFFIG